MAAIQERKSTNGEVSYRVLVRLKGYPQQTATFKRKTDAKKWAQQTEAAIREGRHFIIAEGKKHTFNELVNRYLKEILPLKIQKKKKQPIYQFHWWKEQLGSYTLADITPSLIYEYKNKLSSEITRTNALRTPATIKRYLAALSHMFTIAVKEWQWLDSNPVLKVTKPIEPRGRVRFLSDNERMRLLEACKQSTYEPLYLIVVLCLSTGARKMEIIGLNWDDVDLNREVITLHETKNGDRRLLPITGHALELLRNYAKLRRLDTNLVFPSKAKPKQSIDIRCHWEAAIKKADIEDFRFHDLRHSAASYLAMNGATIAEIAEVLGHKTLQMVKRYSHLSEAHTKSVVSKMNERIFG